TIVPSASERSGFASCETPSEQLRCREQSPLGRLSKTLRGHSSRLFLQFNLLEFRNGPIAAAVFCRFLADSCDLLRIDRRRFVTPVVTNVSEDLGDFLVFQGI